MRNVFVLLFSALNLVLFFPLESGQSATYKEASKQDAPIAPKSYVARDFSHLIGMQGFTDQLLKMHFQLYQGYVKNTNLLLATLKDMVRDGKASSYEYAALKRRLGWEFDGMRLHEFYFENLGGKEPVDRSAQIYQELIQHFGSYEEWKKDFVSTGLMRGIGWVVLYQDPLNGRLINIWVNEHDLGHLAGGKLLLVMDVWEHAFITQFGLDRAKYIDVFFDNLDWQVVNQRYLETFNHGNMNR